MVESQYICEFHEALYVGVCTGVYGDVIRVKIMFNKKDKALIQFADGKQAQLGMTSTNSLYPKSRCVNAVVVVTAELIGRLGTRTTGLKFPSRVC